MRRIKWAVGIATCAVCLTMFAATGEAAAKTSGTLKVGNTAFPVTFAGNESAKAFIKQMPATYKMSELNGNEKYVYLDEGLPSNAKKVGEIKAGDIMLYGSDCVVVFYKSFSTSYSYTKLGRVTDVDGLKKALGKGSVKVSFSVE